MTEEYREPDCEFMGWLNDDIREVSRKETMEIAKKNHSKAKQRWIDDSEKSLDDFIDHMREFSSMEPPDHITLQDKLRYNGKKVAQDLKNSGISIKECVDNLKINSEKLKKLQCIEVGFNISNKNKE